MNTKTELTGLGLRFSDTDTEREFLKFFDSQFIVQFRAAMILGIVLIFIDALVDILWLLWRPCPGMQFVFSLSNLFFWCC